MLMLSLEISAQTFVLFVVGAHKLYSECTAHRPIDRTMGSVYGHVHMEQPFL